MTNTFHIPGQSFRFKALLSFHSSSSMKLLSKFSIPPIGLIENYCLGKEPSYLGKVEIKLPSPQPQA